MVMQYYDNYSLHQWLLCEDWLPTLESRLALDEECARRLGDDRTGGPAVSRQLRLIQILMRDLLIGVRASVLSYSIASHSQMYFKIFKGTHMHVLSLSRSRYNVVLSGRYHVYFMSLCMRAFMKALFYVQEVCYSALPCE